VSDHLISIGVKFKSIFLIFEIIRNIPYPPNFNNTAAKIIDPATGAST
jgi:hypothetical protein